MSIQPRELFPVTFMGPRNDVSKITATENPDGTPAGRTSLDDLPEPTEEELAAIAAGQEPEIITPEADVIPPEPEGMVDDTVDMAGTANTGKGKGAAARG